MIRHSSDLRLNLVSPGAPAAREEGRRFATLSKKNRGWRSARPASPRGYVSPSPPTSRSTGAVLNSAGPLGTPIGVLRLLSPTGETSRLVSAGLDTSVQQLCEQLRVDNIFLQIGNHHSKPLPPTAQPLRVMVELLLTVGYDTTSECLAVGAQPFLRHVFALFLGRPQKADEEAVVLRSKAWVRKGKVVKRWSRADVLLYNHTIRISKMEEEDDIIMLGPARVSRHGTKRGETLRIETASALFCLLFDDPASLHTWLAACQKSELTPRADLSDRGLLLVPEHLFSARGRGVLTHLNLRRNSLQIRADCLNSAPAPLLGWVEDIGRLSLLEHLDLSGNRMGSFPSPLAQLTHLTRLSLGGNQISALPVHIRLLVHLTSLDLSNNWLTDLPSQLADCTYLTALNLSFNRFGEIPAVLGQLRGVTSWQLAGNEIKAVEVPEDWIHRIDKLDLRRNALSRTFRLPSPTGDRLIELDLRDNAALSAIQLTNITSLKVLHADRLQLTHLQVNGGQLTHLYASHNLLDSLVIMPVPSNLVHLDISHNRLSTLPEWLSDLPGLHHVDASHNLLRKLPSRLLTSPSLHTLTAHRNRLSCLPEAIDCPSLEVLDAHANRIDAIPQNFFYGAKKLRDLNLAGNQLEALPSSPPSHRLRTLRLSYNALTEAVVPIICAFRSLVVLTLAHNRIHFFDDSALRELRLLEEINLSGNTLGCLSHALPSLPSLRVLRAHTNALETLPNLSTSASLQIVDVSNNHLSRIDAGRCTGRKLRSLDLTCNAQLAINQHMNSTSFSSSPRKQDNKPLSLVNLRQANISYGFSESAGNRNKLCIQQIRPDPHSAAASLFGMVDGGGNAEVAIEACKLVSEIASEDRVPSGESLSRWLLQVHASLGATGERLGASALLCLIEAGRVHISSSGSIRAAVISSSSICSPTTDSEEHYSMPVFSGGSLSLHHLLHVLQTDDMEYARVRHACSILDENNRIDGVTGQSRQLGLTYLFPAVVPAPATGSMQLTAASQYLMVANASVWSALPDDVITSTFATEGNPHVVAKALQDAAESFGATGNVSVIVVRLGGGGSTSNTDRRSNHYSRIRSPPLQRSSEDVDGRKLRQIEDRLDRISQVIARIDTASPPALSSSPLHYSHPLPSSSSLLHYSSSPPLLASPSVVSSPPPPLPASSPPPPTAEIGVVVRSRTVGGTPEGSMDSAYSSTVRIPREGHYSRSTSRYSTLSRRPGGGGRRASPPTYAEARIRSPSVDSRDYINVSSTGIYHSGPRGTLRQALKNLEARPLRADPLAHLPDPSDSPSPSSLPPPDPSRARFDAARSALADSLRLPPRGYDA